MIMKKKRPNILINFKYGKISGGWDFSGQRSMFADNTRRQSKPYPRFDHDYISSSKRKDANHYEIKKYRRQHNFKAGDDVFLVVFDHKDHRIKIFKTKIIDAFWFTNKKFVTEKYPEFWFDNDIAQTTGIPVENIFKTYREAEFYLYHHWGTP